MKPLRPEASDGEAPGPPPGADECPPPDAIAGLIEGWLSAGERERIEGHIDRCPDCRRCVSELARSAAKQGIAGLDVVTRPETAARAEAAGAP